MSRYIIRRNFASLTIPFPPSANSIWKGGRGRTFRSKEYKDFIGTVAYIWQVGNTKSERGIIYSASKAKEWKTDKQYEVRIELVPRTNRRYDVDNFIKPTLDALTHAGLWDDDSQVIRLIANKNEKENEAYAIVEIAEIEVKEDE